MGEQKYKKKKKKKKEKQQKKRKKTFNLGVIADFQVDWKNRVEGKKIRLTRRKC